MTTNVKADQELPERMVEITNFEVISNDTLSGGDSLLVNFSFTSQWECKIDIAKGLYGCFSTFEDTVSTRNSVHSDTLSVNPDSVYTFSYYVRVNDSGIDLSPSSITLCTKVILDDEKPSHPLNSIDLDIATNSFKNLPGSRELTKIYSPYWCNYLADQDVLCQTYNFEVIEGTFHEPPTISKNIKITGQLVFTDWFEPKKDNENYVEKGAFTDIWMFFVKDGNHSVLYHPVPYYDGNPILNVHYARSNSDGAFEFDFDYKLDSLIGLFPESTWIIKLYIAKENKAINMISDNQYARIHGVKNPYRNINDDSLRIYYHPLFMSYTINPQNNINISLGKKYFYEYNIGDDEACIFRHASLSREFLQERLELDEDSSELPNQTLSYHRRSGPAAGWYTGGAIYMKHGFPRGTIHEYGHYYHGTMGLLGNITIIEGWAIFFTDAVLTWMKRNYGDRRTHAEDCEIAPYCVNEVLDDYYSEDEENPGEYLHEKQEVYQYYPRFGVLSKVSAADINQGTFNLNERLSVKFASYLWNIYDSREDGNFMSLSREGKNNDDIDGLGKLIFDYFSEYNENGTTWSNANITNPLGFHQEFLSRSGISSDLQASVEQLFDFIELGDTDLEKKTNNEMISPQISIDVSYSGSDIDVSFTSNSYDFGNEVYTWYTSFMSYNSSTSQEWRVERNVEITWNIDNRETGTKVYLWDLSTVDWVYHSEISYTTSGYGASFNNVFPAKYKITSFKTNAGEAVSPHIINIPYTGKRTLSDDLTNASLTTRTRVYPNPVQESFVVNYHLENSDIVTVEIIDNTSAIIYTENISSKSGQNYLRLNINSVYSEGVYYVRLLNSNRQVIAAEKIIKIR
jgi:hypothetical protein